MRDGQGMTLGRGDRREHAPGRLDTAQLHVERDEPRAIQRGAGGDPLALELARPTTKLLESQGPIHLAVYVVHRRLSRTGGRHAGAIRGGGRVFKHRAAPSMT